MRRRPNCQILVLYNMIDVEIGLNTAGTCSGTTQLAPWSHVCAPDKFHTRSYAAANRKFSSNFSAEPAAARGGKHHALRALEAMPGHIGSTCPAFVNAT